MALIYNCTYRPHASTRAWNRSREREPCLHYLEFARHEFLKSAGFDFAGSIASGYGLYVTRIEIDYKRPAILDDLLRIESRVLKKGAVSGVLEQTIRLKETIVAHAKVHWAFVDSTGKPCRIPDRWNVPGLSPDA